MTRSQQSGFTLVELAVAIVIIGLLMGGAIATMAAQHKLKVTAETKQLLLETQEALIGFAIAAGRLPCPSHDTDAGKEARNDVTGACTVEHGFVPAATLGIGPTTGGFLIDTWGNPVRYSVTSTQSHAFTKDTAAIRETMTAVSTDYLKVDDDEGEAVVFVIYSTGENANDDAKTGPRSFASNAADDILTSLSRYTLYSRMSVARAL